MAEQHSREQNASFNRKNREEMIKSAFEFFVPFIEQHHQMMTISETSMSLRSIHGLGLTNREVASKIFDY